jgi:hypothetical protein
LETGDSRAVYTSVHRRTIGNQYSTQARNSAPVRECIHPGMVKTERDMVATAFCCLRNGIKWAWRRTEPGQIPGPTSQLTWPEPYQGAEQAI